MLKRILLLTVLIMMSAQIIIHFEDAYSARPMIVFDKPTYSPFSTAKILIVDAASNFDKEKNDLIQAVVRTKSNVGNVFEFTEVAPNTGVFQAFVTLTPNQNEWPADLVVQKDDAIFVEYSSKSGSSASSTDVDFSASMVMFSEVRYATNSEVKIFVLDIGENKVSNAIDTVEVMLWSTSDTQGLKLTLKEVSTDIGVFTGTASLVMDKQSSDNILKVSNSDVITVKYADKTLPPAAKRNDSQTEVKDLFASAIVGQKKTQTTDSLHPPAIVDRSGNTVSYVELGRRIIIQDELVNNAYTNQKYFYIVLIKDMDGITVSLRYMKGELSPFTTIESGISWAAEEVGEYEIETFVWENLDNPVVLAPAKAITIRVTGIEGSSSNI